MRTRPHIVTQTCVIDTGSLTRSATLLAARIGRGGGLGAVLRFSYLLNRIMRMIVDVTERNMCFARRRDVLSDTRLRRRVYEALGGARAMEVWRRRDTWNKARLAAIAAGRVRAESDRGSEQGFDPVLNKRAPRPAGRMPAPASGSDKAPVLPLAPEFRLPVLQNLGATPGRTARASGPRTGPPRRLCTVLWPHELDGQYVPDFISRARRPGSDSGGYAAPAAGDVAPPAIAGAPP